MLEKKLIMNLFNGSYIERWNDQLRPISFREIDKHSHKMMIVFLLGHLQEQKQKINWQLIIEGGIFEYLKRIFTTDIKPMVFNKICSDKTKLKALQNKIVSFYKNLLEGVGNNQEFFKKFKKYIANTKNTSIEYKLLNAAHIYASKWEFDLISLINRPPHTNEIYHYFKDKLETASEIHSVSEIILKKKYRDFIDICGKLRYQKRWATFHRNPPTSVLGHSLFVAILSYLLSFEMKHLNSNKTKKIKFCSKRLYNNFFTGLFHDLPEALTRDIITPVKKSVEGLEDLIKEYEKEMMEEKIYPLLPMYIQNDIASFTEKEFDNKILKINKNKFGLTCYEINKKYNIDKFSPRDGEIINLSDQLAGMIEAYEAINNGSNNSVFKNAVHDVIKKFGVPASKITGGLDSYTLFNQFTD